MKTNNLAAIFIILIAAFAVAAIASQFLPVNNLLSIPNLGSVGLNPTIPISLTSTNNEIVVNKTVTGSALVSSNQEITITASVPAGSNGKCASNNIQFISDIGTLSPTTCSASGSTVSTVCSGEYIGAYCTGYTYNIPPCQCSVNFTSSTPGIATIVAQSTNNPETYINGQTQLTVNWPATPCFGTEKSCSSLTTQNACGAQGGCTWYGAPGCYGTSNVTCQGLDTTTCSHTFGCLPLQGGTCANVDCSYWSSSTSSNLAACAAAGCTYTTSACGGTASSCDSINGQTACSRETGCAWVGSNPLGVSTNTTTPASGTCEGTPSSCGSFTAQTSCVLQNGCSVNSTCGNCQGTPLPCGSYNAANCPTNENCWLVPNEGIYWYCAGNIHPCQSQTSSSSCASLQGCSWNSDNCCTGTATQCNISVDNNSCSAQEGCMWVEYTTTTTTSTTTTIVANQYFIGSNFGCYSASGSYICNMTYANNLEENGNIVFIFVDSDYNVVNSPSASANQGTGLASSVFLCSSYPPGNYNVAWKVYRQSDAQLSNIINSSLSTEKQVITC